MLKGELVRFGRFEWWSEKEKANINSHKDANKNGGLKKTRQTAVTTRTQITMGFRLETFCLFLTIRIFMRYMT